MSFSEIRQALINNLYASIQSWAVEVGPFQVLVAVGLLYIVLVLLKTGFNYLGSLTMVYIRNYVVRDIRNMLYGKIVALPIGFFTKERKGDILQRFTGDVFEIENSIMTSLDMFFKNPIIILITVFARITSYNVCYTKLLRESPADHHSFFQGKIRAGCIQLRCYGLPAKTRYLQSFFQSR